MSGGFRSEVFDCVSTDGRRVVVKLAPNRDLAETEALALKTWANTGVTIRLVDVDLDNAALLLERLYPATPLSSSDEPAAIVVAADILKALRVVPVPNLQFQTLEDAYVHLERRAKEDARYEQEYRGEPSRGRPALDLLPAAHELLVRLCDSAGKNVLLHGDFIAKNLLLHESTYVAIDPMPMVGDPCSDIGFFAAGYGSATNVLERAKTIAKRNGEDLLRAQQWAVVWAILQAAQAWRDDQAELEQLVASEKTQQLLRA